MLIVQQPATRLNLKELLTDQQRARLISKTYRPGETIYSEGEDPKGIFFLKSGILALTYNSENGAESLLRVFTNCVFFGHRSYLAADQYHATLTVLKEAEIRFLDQELTEEVFAQNPKVLLHVAQTMAVDLRNAENRLRDMVGKKASQRVIEALLYLKHKNEDFPWTRREIGEFCGVKTETVSRALGELESLNLIRREGRSIAIVDELKLVDYLNEPS
ncbi:MAG: hypothetical protein CME63_08220 [Halobacteriovoraceae bacterium]|nr:hypothetical protein [Halobacteriovoraceae bacterium]|tara:strand:+ start:42441 stop:43094 length:654 start_codon:yes stop_codon:yes gene_type:complete